MGGIEYVWGGIEYVWGELVVLTRSANAPFSFVLSTSVKCLRSKCGVCLVSYRYVDCRHCIA